MLHITQLMCLTCQRKHLLISLDVVYCKFNKIKCYPQFNCFVLLLLFPCFVVWLRLMVKTDRKQRMLDSWDEIIEDEDEVTDE